MKKYLWEFWDELHSNFNYNCFVKHLIRHLSERNWEEPTIEKYHTYLSWYKRYGRRVHDRYFEDVHYVWRNYQHLYFSILKN